jgi:Ca-activated chloride channel family protein
MKAQKVVERDVVFVIDTSGSMAGEKFKQAMNALRYCVGRLNDGDRFKIIRFSSYVEPWKKDFVPVAEHRKAALDWIDTLVAEGGTDIAGGLEEAFRTPRDPARPFFVVFMTDGKPTMGETTDPRKIMAKVERARAAEGGEAIRLFSWGVGFDVDTHLLDGIADLASGVSEYVRPQEDIEAKVSAFYNKVSLPVLTNLDLQVVGNKVQLVNLYPRALGDLYSGSQLVLIGRYTGEGDVALRLKGRVNQESQEFTWEGTFPASESKHPFIEPLWAKRRIGHLLDEIRLRGETKELVDDVIRLSKEYGIQTPYTSYVILEDGKKLAAVDRRGTTTPDGAPEPALAAAPAPREPEKDKLDKLTEEPALGRPGVGGAKPDPTARKEEEEKQRAQNESAESLARGFADREGKDAVETAGYLRRLREAQAGDEEQGVVPFRTVGKCRFYEYRGLWVDDRFQAKLAMTTVKFGSRAYFRLLERRPELMEPFKIGTALVYVTAPGKVLVVAEAGEEDLSDEKIDELFVAAK